MLLTAHIALVDLHQTAELVALIAVTHRLANLVQHQPGGRITDADLRGQLQRRDALLVVAHAVDRPEPAAQRRTRLVKNRPCRHRTLVRTESALMHLTIRHITATGAITTRTAKTIRPALPAQLLPATRLLAKQGSELLHRQHLAPVYPHNVILSPYIRLSKRHNHLSVFAFRSSSGLHCDHRVAQNEGLLAQGSSLRHHHSAVNLTFAPPFVYHPPAGCMAHPVYPAFFSSTHPRGSGQCQFGGSSRCSSSPRASRSQSLCSNHPSSRRPQHPTHPPHSPQPAPPPRPQVDRKFGSAPDDPGPLATGVSPAMTQKSHLRRHAQGGRLAARPIPGILHRIRPRPPARRPHLDLGRSTAASWQHPTPSATPVTRRHARHGQYSTSGELSTTESDANQHSLAQTLPRPLPPRQEARKNWPPPKPPSTASSPSPASNSVPAAASSGGGATRSSRAPPAWARLYAATGDKRNTSPTSTKSGPKLPRNSTTPPPILHFRDTTFTSQNRKEWPENLLVPGGEGWVMAGIARTSPIPAQGRSRPRHLHHPISKNDVRRRRQTPGPRRPLAFRHARAPPSLRSAGDLRLRLS